MFSLRSKNKYKDITPEIYQNIIERSRSKFFYLKLDIDDNFESRFDIIILHSFIIFYFLKNITENEKKLSQLLFDYMFNDFDNNLREMGFGDIAVNKKMKVFVTAFYGRIAQYSKGMDAYYSNNDIKLLKKTILNNLKIDFLYRKLDQYSWQYCNKGFFNFKKFIPKIISTFN